MVDQSALESDAKQARREQTLRSRSPLPSVASSSSSYTSKKQHRAKMSTA